MFTMNMAGDHMGGGVQDRQPRHRIRQGQAAGLEDDPPAGTEPPGWEWLWELESQGPNETLVRHTYDWSKVTDKKLLEQVGFPLVTEAQLEDTLGRLAAEAAS